MMLRTLHHDTSGLRVALDGNAEIDVRGVGADSRLVRAGDFFFALRGSQTDGARFVAEACARGAIAVAGPAGLTVPAGVTAVVTDDPARLLARVAARFHGDPSAALTMFGVTGTNG
jgi:UDP-N-acetylmuramoyl-L-alanyl-D-glutamate--2,6-diaminopimelate ligase